MKIIDRGDEDRTKDERYVGRLQQVRQMVRTKHQTELKTETGGRENSRSGRRGSN